jgi:peroxiredoxin Q/BCP
MAPDFSLDGTPPGEAGARYQLSAQRGKIVVLAFYPGDYTPVCMRQLAHYESQRQRLYDTGVVLWAISTDKLERHERMAKGYALSLTLLADEKGEVTKLYGIRSLMGTARRGVIIVDGEGKIRYRREDPLSLTYQSVDDILRALGETGLLPAQSAPAAPQPAE